MNGVRLERDAGIAYVTLSRPQTANAIDLDLSRSLFEITSALHSDASVRAVLIRGDGRNFCAGGDLRSFTTEGDRLSSQLREAATYLHAAIVRLNRLSAPVVVSVHGSAAGAGFGLACSADLVLAAESARFLLGYSRIGLSPDGSATFFLPRLVGLRRAQELVLRNRALTAAEAQAWGIVTEVVEDDSLMVRAEAVAAELASGPTTALGHSKRLLWSSYSDTLETQLEREIESLVATAASADAREGIGAFVDRREPRFDGR